MRRALLVVPLAGCFGAGPVPPPPSDATVLLALDPAASDQCRVTPYIGNVAVGADAVYAVTAAFLPPCDNGPGNASELIPSSVLQVPKTTRGPANMLGEAGTTSEGGGQKPHITSTGTDAVWAFVPDQLSVLHIDSKSTTIASMFQATNGAANPVAMVADATFTYVALWSNPQSNVFANHPRFPCCGGGNNPGSPQYNFIKLQNTAGAQPTAMPVVPAFYGEQVKQSLVANTMTLFYLEHAPSPQVAKVSALAKSGSMPEEVALLDKPPVALTADELHVAWATSIDFVQFGSGGFGGDSSPNACAIFVATATAPHAVNMLLQTTQFSCMDVQLDGNFIYFTIVRLDHDFDAFVQGEGLGRINIDTKQLETLALGIDEPEAGPRHIYLDGDGIIAVAPLIVARYQKSALDGHSDFTP